MEPDSKIVTRLARYGQAELLRWWGELDHSAQTELLRQIESIDLDHLHQLYIHLVQGNQEAAPASDRVGAVDVFRLPQTDGERASRRHIAEIGHDALGRGEVAAVLVAGGSGTRLGFEGPKGTFPVGPVSSASLFQIHAEKIVAMGRRYGRPIPLYVMTSPENHAETIAYFEAHGGFGLTHLRFFSQGRMPAVDRETGKILLSSKADVALAPDGHGGTIAALAARPSPDGPSCLDEMSDQGVKTIYYFQVDNPLVKIADPGFLGIHLQARAEMSFKVIEKIEPTEKVGVVVTVDGKPRVIEYSDLPSELAERRSPDGRLDLWAGSIAIHLLELDFVRRLAHGDVRLPYHRAIKKVPYVDATGRVVTPVAPNAVKFEQFIFDALPMAERWTLVETDRAIEFEPLKNATGPDSPETVRARMTELYADWLEAAGAIISRRPDGSIPFAIEISPRFALDVSELKGKIAPGMVVDAPLYLK